MRSYLLFIFVLLLPTYLLSKEIDTAYVQKIYKETEHLKLTHQLTKALLYCDSIINYLKEKEKLYTGFGLQALQQKALVLEFADKNKEAIQALLHMIPLCKKNKEPTTLTHTYISLARLYEKVEQLDDSFNYLEQAQTLINEYKLDSTKARFYCRIASSYRVSDQLDSAKNYTQKALYWATHFKDKEHIAVAHMLSSFLLPVEATDLKIKYLKIAISNWKQINNYHIVSIMFNNIASIYLNQNQLELALVSNDSAFFYHIKHPSEISIQRFYSIRAKTYERLNQLDSALHYLKKSQEEEIIRIKKNSAATIAEVHTIYDTDKKRKTIEEQAQKLSEEAAQRIQLTLIIVSLIALISLLGYFYRSLKKAKEKTEEQAQTIRHINQELEASLAQQKLLLSEIHHRVKNNLQIVISMLEWQAEDANDLLVQHSFMQMANRIYSIAAIHKMMYRKEELDDIEFRLYVQTLCEHIQATLNPNQAVRFDIDSLDISFNLDTLIPLGILINELITNSIKHSGKRLDEQLVIAIRIEAQEVGYLLHYKDNGKELPSQQELEQSTSMGWYLIKSMTRQLKGKLTTYSNHGAIFDIYFETKQHS